MFIGTLAGMLNFIFLVVKKYTFLNLIVSNINWLLVNYYNVLRKKENKIKIFLLQCNKIYYKISIIIDNELDICGFSFY